MSMKQVDAVIIGAGVSGLFAAMRLADRFKRILIIDAGKSLNDRLLSLCDDIASNQSRDRYFGFGGLGLSEGKYNYSNDFGGDLADKIGQQSSLDYQRQVDQLLCQYGAQKRELYSTFDAELAVRAEHTGFNILSTQTRHLGTALSVSVFKAFADYLSSRVEFAFNTRVSHIALNKQQLVLTLSNQHMIQAQKVIIAVGRSGMDLLQPLVQQLGLDYDKTRLDLGFRIEMHGEQLASLLKKTVETKLHYQTDAYRATTYCMNPKGRVIAKYQDNLVMPDGQNSNEIERSRNLNFSLFIPKWFSSLNDADTYLLQTIKKINQQQGLIAAQRLADIDSRFNQCNQKITPTLANVQFTHLADITPRHYLDYTCDFLANLEKLLGQPIDGNTILYAMDSKSYAPVIKTNQYFLISIPHLYMIGDCSGVTSSLSQAAASGLFVADQLR